MILSPIPQWCGLSRSGPQEKLGEELGLSSLAAALAVDEHTQEQWQSRRESLAYGSRERTSRRQYM